MNILMAGQFAPDGVNPIGGTQSWMQTIANHSNAHVDFWEPGRSISKKYDLGIFCHPKFTSHLTEFCSKSILVTHGIVEDERPTDEYDIVLATSEEVRDNWGLDCPILRQPIDTSFWRIEKRNPRSVTRFAYRKGETHSKYVAAQLDLRYVRIQNMTPDKILKVLSQSAIVHATGRAALEAMSCGVPTLIYDNRGYQPHLLDDRDWMNSARTNYSGRGGIQDPTREEVLSASNRIMNSNEAREYIETYHDAKKIAKELLCYSY